MLHVCVSKSRRLSKGERNECNYSLCHLNDKIMCLPAVSTDNAELRSLNGSISLLGREN